MSALNGVRVIELANERCAFAGKLLGDMGADVILVEQPGGDPARCYPPFLEDRPGSDRSLYWWHYNTSKRGVVLDLDCETQREVFRQLLDTADILLEAEPIGRLGNLGLDYEDLCVSHPALVHASITAFGRKTSRKEDLATDLTILAGGGPAWSCGYDDHSLPPIRGEGNQGYQIACSYAVMAILTALFYRNAGGEGQFIDISMHAAANITTEVASYYWLVAESTVQRQTGRHALPVDSMPVQVLAADGRHVTCGVLPRTLREFAGVLALVREVCTEKEFPERIFLERAALRDSIDYNEIGIDDEVTAIFAAAREGLALVASKLDSVSFFHKAQQAGMPVGVIYSPEEAFEDPHFVNRGFQVEVDHPELGQALRYPGAPYKFHGTPWRISRRAPLLNEHADELWDEIDLSEELRAGFSEPGGQ